MEKMRTTITKIVIASNGFCDIALSAQSRDVPFVRTILPYIIGADSTEISLHVLAYNLKRMMSIWGTEGLVIKLREQCG